MPLPPRQERILGGRYRLCEPIGRGGTSVVWRAHDRVLDRDVAVKIVGDGHERFRERLRAEATATGRLRNSHIAHVYDYGEIETEEAATPYLVMELVDGQPLADVLADGASLDWRMAVGIATEVAATLAAAHADGLVHCDVKPDNVLLTADGVKLIDFGISAVEGCDGADKDGHVLGTAAYLAPERLVGAPVGPAADVYALGIMLYRMIAGGLPWSVTDHADLLRAHLDLDPDPLPLSGGAPEQLAELCAECLHKDSSRRPTAAQLAGVLRRLAAHCQDVPVGETTAPPAQTTRTGRRRSQQLVAALAAVAICLTVAMLVWRGDSGPTRAAAGAVPSTVPCVATFTVDRDWGSGFAATLTVRNTGATVHGWTVVFHFTGGQRLAAGASATIPEVDHGRQAVVMRQTGVTVTAANTDQTLATHDSVTLPVAGRYTGVNPIPLDFRLNDRPCVVQVVGAAVLPTPTTGGGLTVANPTPTQDPATRSGSSGRKPPTGTAAAAPISGVIVPVAASRVTSPTPPPTTTAPPRTTATATAPATATAGAGAVGSGSASAVRPDGNGYHEPATTPEPRDPPRQGQAVGAGDPAMSASAGAPTRRSVRAEPDG